MPAAGLPASAFPGGTSTGITVRDYFAAAALTGLLASHRTGAMEALPAKAAQDAYDYAKAMELQRASGE